MDSQQSLQGGVICQVLGELSNNGSICRKFSQTFFLAEQPEGYYVLNDIFRFLKEDVALEYEFEEEAFNYQQLSPKSTLSAPADAARSRSPQSLEIKNSLGHQTNTNVPTHTGSVPATNVPTGSIPATNVPTGSVPTTNVPTGSVNQNNRSCHQNTTQQTIDQQTVATITSATSTSNTQHNATAQTSTAARNINAQHNSTAQTSTTARNSNAHQSSTPARTSNGQQTTTAARAATAPVPATTPVIETNPTAQPIPHPKSHSPVKKEKDERSKSPTKKPTPSVSSWSKIVATDAPKQMAKPIPKPATPVNVDGFKDVTRTRSTQGVPTEKNRSAEGI